MLHSQFSVLVMEKTEPQFLTDVLSVGCLQLPPSLSLHTGFSGGAANLSVCLCEHDMYFLSGVIGAERKNQNYFQYNEKLKHSCTNSAS